MADIPSPFDSVQMHGRPYHPQSQGRVERFNRTMTKYFRVKLVDDANWVAKLPEFYYSYNNRVNKATRPSTPYQLFYKRPNFAAPLDAQVPYGSLTREERQFLETAHIDVDEVTDTEDSDITFEEALDYIDSAAATPQSMPTLSPVMDSVTGNESDSTSVDALMSGEMLRIMSSMPIASTASESPIRTSMHPTDVTSVLSEADSREDNIPVQAADNQVQLEFLRLQDGVSPYYKKLYMRRFLSTNHTSTAMSASRKRRLVSTRDLYTGMYPMEEFSTTVETEEQYLPANGDDIYYRVNPALNKGTAVFTSGHWRRGVCSSRRFVSGIGHQYVVVDGDGHGMFELNRHQIKRRCMNECAPEEYD